MTTVSTILAVSLRKDTLEEPAPSGYKQRHRQLPHNRIFICSKENRMTDVEQREILGEWINLLFLVLSVRALKSDQHKINYVRDKYREEIIGQLVENAGESNSKYNRLIDRVKAERFLIPDRSYERPTAQFRNGLVEVGGLESIKYIKEAHAHEFREALSKIRPESVASQIKNLKSLVQPKSTLADLDFKYWRERIDGIHSEPTHPVFREKDDLVFAKWYKTLYAKIREKFEELEIVAPPITRREELLRRKLAGLSSQLSRHEPPSDFQRFRNITIECLREFDRFVMPLSELDSIDLNEAA